MTGHGNLRIENKIREEWINKVKLFDKYVKEK